MLFLKLAWRNVLRNPRRAGLTIAVIVIGVAALVFTWALFDGSNNQSISTMTGTFTGHVQIHGKGYTDDPSLDRAISGRKLDMQALARVPGVQAVSPRLQAPVMVSTGDTSRGVLLVGVDTDKELAVTTLNKKIAHGDWFSGGGREEIILGASLAKALNVTVGDTVSVLTQGFEGSIGAAKYRVRGIYQTGNEMIDGLQAFISMGDAVNLLSAEDRLTGLAFKLDSYDKSQHAVEQISRQLDAATYEVEGWEKLLPDVAQKVSFHEWIASVVMVILFGIVMVGVTNTVMMSALERTREFGVVMALGTTPDRVFWLILLEGALLGVIGFVMGLLIGGAMVAHFGANGIDMSSMSTAVQQLPGISNKLYPHLSLDRMLLLGSVLLLVTICSAIYPAWRTASLLPLQAMRRGKGDTGMTVGERPPSNMPVVPLLALRNIGRHPLRALLTGFGVTFALATFVFLGCFVVGYYHQLVENSTGFLTGDGQIQHGDFRARLEPGLTVKNGEPLMAQLRQLPNVKSVSARAQSPAMVSSAKSAEPVLLLGVQPEEEKAVTFLYKSVKKGRYLESNGKREVVIGRKLAERLRVEVGEKVVVTIQDVQGSLAAEAFMVVGLFDTGSHGFDETMAQVPLPFAQKMMGIGSEHSSIAFRLKDADQLDTTMASVRELIKDPSLKAYKWMELLPEVVQMNAMFKGSLFVVMSVVFITIAVVIMNTIMMTVFERTREFGTMLSIGSPPNLIVRIVVLEAAVVGGVGTLIGLGLGALAAWAHSITGMSMKAHGLAAIPGTTDIVFPQLTMGSTLQPAFIMMGMILAVSLYPAWRGSRLEPVEALRAV